VRQLERVLERLDQPGAKQQALRLASLLFDGALKLADSLLEWRKVNHADTTSCAVTLSLLVILSGAKDPRILFLPEPAQTFVILDCLQSRISVFVPPAVAASAKYRGSELRSE
jgi:hypothetical protein